MVKVTIEIDAESVIEDLEDAVPNPTGGKETVDSVRSFIEEYDTELKEVIEEWVLRKLIDYHSH